jgi:hypothetical protein
MTRVEKSDGGAPQIRGLFGDTLGGTFARSTYPRGEPADNSECCVTRALGVTAESSERPHANNRATSVGRTNFLLLLPARACDGRRNSRRNQIHELQH